MAKLLSVLLPVVRATGLYHDLRGFKYVWYRDILRDHIAFHREFLRRGDLVFDVGANCGDLSEIYLRLGAQVVAFEPQKQLTGPLRRRLWRFPQFNLVSEAVGERVEEKTFYLKSRSPVASFREDWEGVTSGTTTVPVTTLDTHIARHGLPRYIKIDVEGWELGVVKGLSRAVPWISFEFHKGPEHGQMAQQVLVRLLELGDYEMNLRADLAPSFLWDEFIPVEDRLDRLPQLLDEAIDGLFGEIFLRLRSE